MKIWLNGQLIDETKAMISVFDRSYLYGEGIFETLRSYKGRPAFFDYHYHRFSKNCEKLDFIFPLSKEELEGVIEELLHANRLKDAAIRMTFSFSGASFGLERPKKMGYHLTLFCRPIEIDPHFYDEGVLVLPLTQFLNDPWPNSTIKTTSYMTKMKARLEAAKASAYDAILKNVAGFWVEGSKTNLFLCTHKTVVTAPIEDGLLPGVTRAIVLEILKEEKIPFRQDHITDELLKNAEEVFLTGSTSEVMPVKELLGMWKKPVEQNGLSKHLLQSYRKRLELTLERM